MLLRVCCSAALGSEGELPREFLLFAPGVTKTSKGEFTTNVAAIMAAQRAYGVRLMIDSEHASLNDEVFKVRGDARDALGYFDVEARADGSVWAVNVEWTPVGAERLRSKKAVYISPAFYTNEERQVTEIINAALTSMPATHRAPQLVAASRLAFGAPKRPRSARVLAALSRAASIISHASKAPRKH